MIVEITKQHTYIINARICPYCGNKTKIASALQVYGEIFKNRIIIECENFQECDSYCGNHRDGIPLGCMVM